MMVDLSRLTTEQRNPATMDLDQMSPLEIAAVMNQEDKKAVLAVQQVLPQVATAIQWAADSLRQGGRLIYMGAGTSGRLGVLDAVECPPTFGSAPETVVGLIAGGDCAFVKAVEGAEDSCTLGAEDLQHIHLQPPDLVVGLAASGRTPYVIHGLRYARSIGCKTVAIACNAGSLIGQEADLAIEPVTGPEVLTGSTRLKADSEHDLHRQHGAHRQGISESDGGRTAHQRKVGSAGTEHPDGSDRLQPYRGRRGPAALQW